jgi:hypothetical protein
MVEAWSKSSLKSLLEGCSWQWALRKVYGIEDHGSPQTAMGTGFHYAVEKWEKSQRTLSLEHMQGLAAEKAFEESKKLPMQQWYEHATDPQQVVDFAKESVRLWWEEGGKGIPLKQLVEEWDCLGVEAYWKSLFSDYAFPIHGFVDAVYESERFIIVSDLKTASSMRRWKYDQPMNVEVAMYLALAEAAKNEGLLPSKEIIFQYHVVSAKEGKVRLIEMGGLDAAGIDLLQQTLQDATTIEKHSAYRPKTDWNLCSPKYCSYWQGCRVDGTLSPYSLTTSNVPNAGTPLPT